MMANDATFEQSLSESFEHLASDLTKNRELCDGDKAERESYVTNGFVGFW